MYKKQLVGLSIELEPDASVVLPCKKLQGSALNFWNLNVRWFSSYKSLLSAAQWLETFLTKKELKKCVCSAAQAVCEFPRVGVFSRQIIVGYTYAEEKIQ